MTNKTKRYTITLEAKPGFTIAALRKFLKLALRSAGLKCVRIEADKADVK